MYAPGRGLLIQMAGHPGSGKSTVARQIAAGVGAMIIDLDTIKSALLNGGSGWDDASRWSYFVIYGLVDDALAAGTNVVVDTPSYWTEIHERLTAAATKHDVDYAFVECVADEAIRSQRLHLRSAQRSQVPELNAMPSHAPTDCFKPELEFSGRLRLPPDSPRLDGRAFESAEITWCHKWNRTRRQLPGAFKLIVGPSPHGPVGSLKVVGVFIALTRASHFGQVASSTGTSRSSGPWVR